MCVHTTPFKTPLLYTFSTRNKGGIASFHNKNKPKMTSQYKPLVPVNESDRGLFNTSSGRLINLADPDPKNLDIYDIAHALSQICRFGGHARPFYSVAQHSVLVANLVPKECRQYALLHDAAEAYVGDVIKPLKIILGAAYSRIEKNFEYAIMVRFQPVHNEAIANFTKAADLQALHMEHQALIAGNPGPLACCMEDNLMDAHGWAWEPDTARQIFLATYYKLFS